jgi:hypothetical protein
MAAPREIETRTARRASQAAAKAERANIGQSHKNRSSKWMIRKPIGKSR